MGILAGTINTVVGSGTLLTFPVLLAFGYAPVLANVSNTVGLVPGSAAGAIGYRRELRGQRGRLQRLAGASVIGGGGRCRAAADRAGLGLSLDRDRVHRHRADPDRRRAGAVAGPGPPPTQAPATSRTLGATAAVFVTGVYGGYFGAAQGILLLGILSLALDDDLQRINALKVVLAGLVNLVSGLVFICVAQCGLGARPG